MIFVISLAAAAVLIWAGGKALRARPAPFYAAAAICSALTAEVYWLAPDFLSPQLRAKLPLVLGAFGTACFVFVMAAGALPNGHPLMKKIMPIRGELSIFACLLTLGHNLSYGKNYLTPGYLFSGPVSPAKAAAWISVVSILLMLVLSVTSVKAVRRRFRPDRWKALQRWAYLFYALIYLHVLLLTIPGLLKGRTSYLPNLLVYSLVFLSYAVCRVQKAVLTKRKKAPQVTPRRQLAGAGAGALLSLALLAGVTLSPASGADSQTADVPAPAPSAPQPSGTDAWKGPVGGHTAEPAPAISQEVSPEPDAPSPDPAAGPGTEPPPEPAAETAPAVDPAPAVPAQMAPEPSAAPAPSPAPAPTPEPAPASAAKYRDGTFTGTGMGYAGPVTVSVTISDDTITDVTVISHEDDDEYMGDAQDGVIPSILISQSADVSAVSGATYSSEGIMEAVAAALAEAADRSKGTTL